MLISTNRNTDGTYPAQSFTNPLVIATVLKPEGTPVTSGVTYSITEKPAGLGDQITVDAATGEVGFGKPALDRVNADGPQTITVQAAYQGKTYRYTFTLTDHFSPREQHTSVVMDGDIYVIGGTTRNSVGTFPPSFIPAVQSSEVWRSSDRGLTWDQAADTRFTARSLHGSAALNGALYVIAGVYGDVGITPRDDVWKSADRGVNWSRITPAGADVEFPMDNSFASAVRGDGIYLLGGIRRSPFARLNEVWQFADLGQTWTNITATAEASPPRFPARAVAASVVTEGGSAGAFYLIGGSDDSGNDRDDVWTSEDGTSWTQANASAAAGDRFPGRRGHSAAALSEAGGDALYVIGGLRGGNARSDVWKSVDQGAAWNQVVANAEFSNRADHSSVVLGGELYLIGGARSSTELFNDVWKSADGGRTWVNVHKN